MLLARRGVPAVVLEARTKPTQHPQAHFINIRSMEVFREIGGEDLVQRINEASPPTSSWRQFIYCRSLLGQQLGCDDHFAAEPWPRRLQRAKPADSGRQTPERAPGVQLGCGQDAAKVISSLSACQPVHLAQTRLAPILAEEATVRRGVDVRFGTRLQSWQQTQSGTVLAETLGPDGEVATLECQFLVGADGAGSRVRELAGMSFDDPKDLQDLINVHFWSPELARLLRNEGREAMLYFIWNADTIAVLVAHDLNEGQFVMQIPYFPPLETVEQHFTPEACQELIRSVAGADIGPVDIRNVQGWKMSACVANAYVKDRIVLAGDSCHIFPPAGAFGMNTGIQDAHNLAWKLAAALKDESRSPDLLRSYQTERAAVARRTAEVSIANVKSVWRISSMLGLDRGLGQAVVDTFRQGPLTLLPSSSASAMARGVMSVGRRLANSLEGNGPVGTALTRRIRRHLQSGQGLGMLFLGQDLGCQYDAKAAGLQGYSGGFGSPTCYQPSFEPGARLPHFWLDSDGGDKVSSHDLVARANDGGVHPVLFCFVAPGSGVVPPPPPPPGVRQILIQPCDSPTSMRGIGHLDARSPTTWEAKLFEPLPPALQGHAALLVRPDGHVAWSAATAPTAPELGRAVEDMWRGVLGSTPQPPLEQLEQLEVEQ